MGIVLNIRGQCLTPKGKVIVSQHVIFDEKRFLFTGTNSLSPVNEFVVTFVPIVHCRSSVNASPPHSNTKSRESPMSHLATSVNASDHSHDSPSVVPYLSDARASFSQ